MYVMTGQVLRLAMAFILLPVAARVLGEASFGRYSLATTIMFFVMLVDDFGLNMWVTREVAKYRDRAERYVAYTVGLKIVLILASVVFLALFLCITPYDDQAKQSIWIFAIYGILISFRDLAIAVFRAFEDMAWESVVLSVEKTLVTGLGIAVLVSGGRLIALSWAFVFAAVISLVLSAFILFPRFVRPKIAFSAREFWPMLKGASVFGISLFLTTIYSRIDTLMLSFMKGQDVLGWYSAAHKLVDFTNVIPTVLMIATFPALSRSSIGIGEQLDRMFTRGFNT
jgi:O-antigen/teichoic acid export membrane protein